jgi:site-specific recombinase XerC
LPIFANTSTRVRRQSVATVNRALVSVRRFLGHLVKSGALPANPAESVRELRRSAHRPQGDNHRAGAARSLREIELRQDRRAGGIIGLMLFGGLRVSVT